MSNEPTPVLRATLPPGCYIIGDPCYSIGADHADWMAWLEAADYTIADRNHVLVAPYNGRLCVGVSTAYGDGVYLDEDGNQYGVDAGMIGAVHVESADCESVQGANVVEFASEFDCFYDDGVIHLGHITINTDPYYCEDCECEVGRGEFLCDDCEYERAHTCASCGASKSDNFIDVCDECMDKQVQEDEALVAGEPEMDY